MGDLFSSERFLDNIPKLLPYLLENLKVLFFATILLIVGILAWPAIKDINIYNSSMKVAGLINAFPKKGAYSLVNNQAYPMMSLYIPASLLLLMVIKKEKSLLKDSSSKIMSISILMLALSISLYLFGCIPYIVRIIPESILRYVGPSSIVLISQLLGFVSIPMLISTIHATVSKKITRNIIYTGIVLTMVIPSIYLLNSIAYESIAIWL